MATPAGGKKRAQNVEETENNTSPDKRKMKKQKVQGSAAPGGAAAAAPPAAAGKGKGDAKKKAATAAAIAAISGAAAAPAAGAGAGAGAGLTKKQKKAQKAKAAGAEAAPAPAKRPAAAAAAADDDDDAAGAAGAGAGAFDDGPALDALQSLQKSLDRVDAKYAIEKLRIEQKIAGEKKELLAARADAIKGVTGFWKTALLGAESLRSVLHPEVDMPILDALTEVSVKPLSGAAGVGYTITFAFDTSAALPFANAKLERTYKFVPLNEQKPAAAAAAAAGDDDDDDAEAPIAPECRVTCSAVQWRDPQFGTEEDKESFFREFFDGEKAADDNSEDIIGNTIAEVFRNPLPFFLDGLNPDGDDDLSEGDMDDFDGEGEDDD